GLAGAATGAAQTGGVLGMAKAAGGAAVSPLRAAAQGLKARFEAARQAQHGAPPTPPGQGDASQAPPAWAQRMQTRQHLSHGAATTAAAVNSGDAAGGGGGSVDLSEGS
ncbi:nonfunctional conjugative transfer protein TrbL, partial [Caulobacter sp. RHG1]|nr:nonfunctional conjugative transfer protein TrbL [Caulobacter sp. RHG1]